MQLHCRAITLTQKLSFQPAEISYAKALCGDCPVQRACLQGALSRQEPVGVWGGELFEDGKVIAAKRMPGRPRNPVELASAEVDFAELMASVAS